jgi:hypothetical protein
MGMTEIEMTDQEVPKGEIGVEVPEGTKGKEALVAEEGVLKEETIGMIFEISGRICKW